jgi:hypothetical protein
MKNANDKLINTIGNFSQMGTPTSPTIKLGSEYSKYELVIKFSVDGY